MYQNIRIETERLRLRTFSENDLNHLFRIVNDKKLMSNVPFAKERTMSECQNLLGRILKRYKESTISEFKGFLLLIESKRLGEQMGFVGLFPLTYNPDETEIFYGLFEQYTGMGYATETGKEVIEYAFNTLGFNKIVASVNQENKSSIRVLERLGMSYDYKISHTNDSSYDGENMYSIHKNNSKYE